MPPMKNRKCSCSKHFITSYSRLHSHPLPSPQTTPSFRVSLIRSQKKKKTQTNNQPKNNRQILFLISISNNFWHFAVLSAILLPFEMWQVTVQFKWKFLSLSLFSRKQCAALFQSRQKTWDCCQSCASQQQGINPLDSVTKFRGCYNRSSQTSATTYNCSF